MTENSEQFRNAKFLPTIAAGAASFLRERLELAKCVVDEPKALCDAILLRGEVRLFCPSGENQHRFHLAIAYALVVLMVSSPRGADLRRHLANRIALKGKKAGDPFHVALRSLIDYSRVSASCLSTDVGTLRALADEELPLHEIEARLAAGRTLAYRKKLKANQQRCVKLPAADGASSVSLGGMDRLPASGGKWLAILQREPGVPLRMAIINAERLQTQAHDDIGELWNALLRCIDSFTGARADQDAAPGKPEHPSSPEASLPTARACHTLSRWGQPDTVYPSYSVRLSRLFLELGPPKTRVIRRVR